MNVKRMAILHRYVCFGIFMGTILAFTLRALYYYAIGIETDMPIGLSVVLSPVIAIVISILSFMLEFAFYAIGTALNEKAKLIVLGMSYSTPLFLLISPYFAPLVVAINPITIHVYYKLGN